MFCAMKAAACGWRLPLGISRLRFFWGKWPLPWSRATLLWQNQRRKRLLDFDVSEAEVQQLHGPVGLNIGALTPPEIAMSIVAEMTAMRRGTDLSKALSNWEGSKTVCALVN